MVFVSSLRLNYIIAESWCSLLWSRTNRFCCVTSTPNSRRIHCHTSSITTGQLCLRTVPVRFIGVTNQVTMATLETLNFDNRALKVLPVEEKREHAIRQVSGACFARVDPTPVKNPMTVAYSVPAMEMLDLGITELERDVFPVYLSGNKILTGAQPAAHCYCGHQFGNFAGQLGDGATMYLGEVINKKAERWEVQFKGAGLTPFSRSADGRKVLRSSIREFLCSEAMHHLGIPTTRAGSIVTSDSKVVRDIFYTGNSIMERATIILRIAQTFIRFGSFEICKPTDPMTGRKGPSVGNVKLLETLLNYTVETFYPKIWEANPENKTAAYLEFFRELVSRTAHLVAEWQCVGWCHGVLNTDNMSIVGLTIDYGPYGFMDGFNRSYICNESDDSGRYAYDQQPSVCKWNLGKLAEQLVQFIPAADAKGILETYDQTFNQHYMSKMRKKLGLLNKEEPTDSELVEEFLDMLEATGSDMTNSFRLLSRITLPGVVKETKIAEYRNEIMEGFLAQCCTIEELQHVNRPQMEPQQLQMLRMLAQMNPALLEQLGSGAAAVKKELKRVEKYETLKKLTAADKKNSDRERWQVWFGKYEERLQLEAQGVVDCQAANRDRVKMMNANNPRFILRNYIAQNAIVAAEKGDYSEVRRVLRLLEMPYAEETALADERDSASTSVDAPTADRGLQQPKSCTGVAYDNKPPVWATDLKVT